MDRPALPALIPASTGTRRGFQTHLPETGALFLFLALRFACRSSAFRRRTKSCAFDDHGISAQSRHSQSLASSSHRPDSVTAACTRPRNSLSNALSLKNRLPVLVVQTPISSCTTPNRRRRITAHDRSTSATSCKRQVTTALRCDADLWWHFGHRSDIRHPRIKPQVVSVWIEDDWHAVVAREKAAFNTWLSSKQNAKAWLKRWNCV